MRDDKKYAQVFDTQVNLNLWVIIATIIRKTDSYLIELRQQFGDNIKATRFLKNYRQIVMFITMSRIMESFSFSCKKLSAFDVNLYTKDMVKQSIEDLNEACPNFITSRKLRASSYYDCYNYVAEKYNLRDIESIRNQSRKLWPENRIFDCYGLSQKYIEDVFSRLPAQPWPVKIHQKIAQELGSKDITVSNAISYLIYSGKVKPQVYGFVFDENGAIITEGNHYGHTEQEARKKLAEQLSMIEAKFSF